MRRVSAVLLVTSCVVAVAAFSANGARSGQPAGPPQASAAAACPAPDTSISLPTGFCASIFADHVGDPRHLVVAPNGDVFTTLEFRRLRSAPGSDTATALVALRDVNHDGVSDSLVRVRGHGGTGVALYNGYLYIDEAQQLVRYKLHAGDLEPTGDAEVVVEGIPIAGDHNARNFLIDKRGNLYLNIGTATNACQAQNRVLHSLGADPCKELDTRGGIWKFDANALHQKPTLANRFATGVRNAEGMQFDPRDGSLWTTQHGRDQLHDNWPELFTVDYQGDNPGEELIHVHQGDDFGWPYCYYSMVEHHLVLAPEYGGDGTRTGRCAEKKEPVAAFPGHWAPMSLLFYTGKMLPAKYTHGAFIAFHGSWNRAPLPQAGYNVVFQPLVNGAASGAYEVFANGFGGATPAPGKAAHRPAGLAQGPDGALYVTDDAHGRIWRIVYDR